MDRQKIYLKMAKSRKVLFKKKKRKNLSIAQASLSAAGRLPSSNDM
jgi:hypothetical protein